MNSAAPPRDWIQRYLTVLEVDQSEPNLDTLTRLCRAHLQHVPFENVSSILRRASSSASDVPLLDREVVLRNWAAGRAGGLCFEVGEMFGHLLRGLGFQAYPILAQISFPGSHQALYVDLTDARYLVDVGNGAPFFDPIVLDGVVELARSGLHYRFRPDSTSADHWIQDRWINNAWAPFCTYDLRLPGEPARAAAYQRHHIPGESWVVDTLSLIRCTDDSVWTLRANQLTHITTAGKTVESLAASDEYRRVASEVFHLPNLPITAAIEALHARVST